VILAGWMETVQKTVAAHALRLGVLDLCTSSSPVLWFATTAAAAAAAAATAAAAAVWHAFLVGHPLKTTKRN
jgi:hypothetical protein